MVLPSGTPSQLLRFGIEVTGRIPGTDTVITGPPALLEVRLAEGYENNAQERDLVRSVTAAKAWHAVLVRRAAQMNRHGDRLHAQSYLERELHYFRRYCSGIAELRGLAEELETMLAHIGRSWDERTRKEMELAAYRAAESKRDYRRALKASWSSRLSGRR
jgi:hypothetical protein